MHRFEFGLSISARDYLQYYRGEVRNVRAICLDGRTVQFPATLLTPFVTGRGIHGNFVLTCDHEGKGSQLRQQ